MLFLSCVVTIAVLTSFGQAAETLSVTWISQYIPSTTREAYYYGLTLYESPMNGTQACVSGTINLSPTTGQGDFHVARFDSNGLRKGLYSLGSNNPSSEYAYAVAADSNANIYFTGVLRHAFTSGQTYGGAGDVGLVKYDTVAKQLKWTRLLSSSAYEQGSAVVVDSDNANCYIAGYSEGALDTQTNAGLEDAFLAKFNSDGVKQWMVLFGSVGNDRATAIAIDEFDGGIIVTGYTEGNIGDGDSNLNAGGQDIFIAKYSPTGTRRYCRLFGSSGADKPTAIVYSSTFVYITGSTTGALDGQTNAGGEDMFLSKYDSWSVQRQWTKTLGTSGTDVATSIAPAQYFGDIVIAGYTTGNLDGLTHSAQEAVFVSKFRNDGYKKWTWLYVNFTTQRAQGIAVKDDDHIYIGGYYEQPGNNHLHAGYVMLLGPSDAGGGGGGGSGGGSKGSTTLSTGATVGIALGAAAGVAALGALVYANPSCGCYDDDSKYRQRSVAPA